MGRDYASAALPAPTQILGLRLKPFSLGHVILLRRHDCAFVSDEQRDAQIDDLLMGVLICSMTWEEWSEFEQSDGFETEIRRWGKAACRAAKEDDSFNILHRFKLFNSYVTEASQMPPVWIEKEPEHPSGSDWFQNVKLTLMEGCKYTQSEALNCPLQQALLDYCKHAEAQGILRIVSKEELALMQQQEATCPN